ncbi:MAG: hypothetical protein QM775_19575 [Pirellulales bacterium]
MNAFRVNRFASSFAVVGLLWSGGLFAADVSAVKSLPSLQCELLQAAGTYEALDASAAAMSKPIVYVIIPSSRWDRPVARFLKTLDDKLPGVSATAEVRAVWLSGDKNATQEYLPKVMQSLQLQRTNLGVFPDESGPEGWQPGNDAQAFVVVGHQGKNTAEFKFGSVNETDVESVTNAVAKALDLP